MSTTQAAAFTLRDEFAGTTTVFDEEGAEGREVPIFGGATVALHPGGETFDVAEELDEGDGTIVVNTLTDPMLAEQLRVLPVLKEVPVPEGQLSAATGYDHATAKELKAEARRRGISPLPSKKEDLIATLVAHDEALQAGDQAHADEIAAGGGTEEA